MIGDEIEVSVLAVAGEKVRLGIEAPKHVPVFRKEVYLEILDERSGGQEAQLRDDSQISEEVDRALDRLKTSNG
jgi:carbon storage regulator